MKNVLLSCTLLALVISVSCNKKKDSSPANSARVMFVNGTAGTTNIDVSVNGTVINAASNVAYLKNSGYQYVTAGTDAVAFVLTNLGTPLKNTSVSFTANMYYSVFSGGLITGPAIVAIPDDLAAPSSGNAKIRFVNLSTDTLSETAYVGANSFATGITSLSWSPFTEVASGSYTIKAGDPANISTVVSLSAQQLDAGKIYTVMLTGTLSGTGTSGLTLTIVGNN